VISAIAVTAFSNDSLVRGVTVDTPLTFRTYWRAAARISSGLAAGSSPRSVVMFRHMLREYDLSCQMSRDSRVPVGYCEENVKKGEP
jgi:hypothetical protein